MIRRPVFVYLELQIDKIKDKSVIVSFQFVNILFGLTSVFKVEKISSVAFTFIVPSYFASEDCTFCLKVYNFLQG